MGSSRTPTFRVEYSGVVDLTARRRVSWTPSAWNARRDGRPTDARLAEYIKASEDATLPGGVNEHLGVTRIGSARIVRQATGEVVASWAAPMFAAQS